MIEKQFNVLFYYLNTIERLRYSFFQRKLKRRFNFFFAYNNLNINSSNNYTKANDDDDKTYGIAGKSIKCYYLKLLLLTDICCTDC